MQAITAPALPSSVPSPQPTSPASVSSFTKTYGRSESGVRETPNTFMPVIRTLEPTRRNASLPSGSGNGSGPAPPPHSQAWASALAVAAGPAEWAARGHRRRQAAHELPSSHRARSW